jgi:broad specificity polyphosphatase/5'/3'-nucleotidase SurE
VQGQRNHVTTIARRDDPRGLQYFWIEEGENDWLPHDHSDYQTCRDGYASITPLQPDMTAHAALHRLRALLAAPAPKTTTRRRAGGGRRAAQPATRVRTRR